MTAKSPIQWPETARDGHARKRLPRPLYGALVVTLTVFLAGLVAGRPAVEGYLVRAELAIEARTPTEVSKPPEVIPASRSPGDVLADVSWQSRVGTAVRRADARMSAGGEGVDRPENHGRTAEVARHVRVIADSLTDGPPRLRVFYRGVDPVWSLALVQELTQSLLDESTETSRENRQLDASIAHAQWRVDQYRHYARKSQFDLERASDGEALAMLRADAARAQVQCEQSEAVLHGLLAARAKELDERRAPRRWLTTPAQITHRFGGNFSRDRVAVIGLLAVCCGAGAAWQIVRVRSDCGRIGLAPAVSDGAGIATRTGLAQGARSASAHRIRTIRWTTTACEWTLAAIVAVFCLAAIDDPSLPARMQADLFGTFGEVVSGVFHR